MARKAPATAGIEGKRPRPSLERARPRRGVAVVVALVGLLVGALVATTAPAGATAFPDVPEDHPFAVPIDWAVTTGVTNGFADGTFRPTVAVSRQAFAAFLARYDDGASDSELTPCEGDGPFTDVPASHPFCAEITWLVDLGITTGFPDETFRPTNPISRQAMAAFLTRYAADDEPDPCEGNGPFTDVPATHPFCAEITWMVDEGITTGFPDDTFRPTNPISRQAAAAFLWRLAGEPTGITTRVSVTADGTQSAGTSGESTISAGGSTVAFTSFGTEFVPGITNGRNDVFIRDLATGTVERVSVSSNGDEANNSSSWPVLSADGRYVAFDSRAENLVSDDDNGVRDIFVHDRQTGTTERVSVSSDGAQADGTSERPSISADGRYVAFASEATNLVADDENEQWDVFVHDRQTGTTERVSVDADGDEADGYSGDAAISGDGRFVAFMSDADLTDEDTPLLAIFVHDRQTGTTTLGSPTLDGEPADALAANASLSHDGRLVAFASAASNQGPGAPPPGTPDATNVWLHDRVAGTTELISASHDGTVPDNTSNHPHLSPDGRFVAFTSFATNLVDTPLAAGREVYVRDRATDATSWVSVGIDGEQGDAQMAIRTSISADGRTVAFTSEATNLVPDDTNDRRDAFIRTRFGVG
ncbi:MAG: S-layer homology domain-containing protein [Acidimicrobiia bacterium]|nr:S-layer homology domain-containing protein [Acidimicrobiia bacterium]